MQVARRWFEQDPDAWREEGVDGPDDLRKQVRQVLTCASNVAEQRLANVEHRLGVLVKEVMGRGGLVLYAGVDERPSISVQWPPPASNARLSKLLFESRELIEMFTDVVEARAGKPDTWGRRVVREIDQYRAEQGWSPHGFGEEEGVVMAGWVGGKLGGR